MTCVSSLGLIIGSSQFYGLVYLVAFLPLYEPKEAAGRTTARFCNKLDVGLV